MKRSKVITVSGLISYIEENSTWKKSTVHNVVKALGYSVKGGRESLAELSGNLADCAEHGADGGFSGFIYRQETIAFFLRNRTDIVKNLELAAEEQGEDVIKTVQNFGIFRYSPPPGAGEIGRALWGAGKAQDDLTPLYEVFAWFCLEEISHVWYRYLEDNPDSYTALSA